MQNVCQLGFHYANEVGMERVVARLVPTQELSKIGMIRAIAKIVPSEDVCKTRAERKVVWLLNMQR